MQLPPWRIILPLGSKARIYCVSGMKHPEVGGEAQGKTAPLNEPPHLLPARSALLCLTLSKPKHCKIPDLKSGQTTLIPQLQLCPWVLCPTCPDCGVEGARSCGSWRQESCTSPCWTEKRKSLRDHKYSKLIDTSIDSPLLPAE